MGDFVTLRENCGQKYLSEAYLTISRPIVQGDENIHIQMWLN